MLLKVICKKKVSPAIFALAALFFFLPFVTVSCSGHEVATISGAGLLTGVKVPAGGTTDPYPLAIILIIPAICGMIFGLVFLKNKRVSLISAITGAAGFLATILIKLMIDHEASAEGLGTSAQSGFYLMLLAYAAAAGFNGYMIARENSGAGRGVVPGRSAPPERPMPPGRPAPPAAPKPAPAEPQASLMPSPVLPPATPAEIEGGRLCGSCGAVNKPSSKFCQKCGKPLALAPKEIVIEQNRASMTDNISPGDREDETSLLCPLMKIVAGGREEIIPVNKPEFLLGRDKEAVDYWVKDNKYVGRVHAKITVDRGTCSITDLDSKNGTFLNGERLPGNKPYKLTAGDKAALANFEFIFIC